MSEYQYYEFAAVDVPLSPQQQAELRSRSSRATITPGSFINAYHFGSLKGDPLDWMQRYFDAHVYSSSWGQCRLMLRVPVGAIDRTMLDACIQPAAGRPRHYRCRPLDAEFVDGHCLLDWSFHGEDGDCERFWAEDDGPGWMARLLPLRDELLRGDPRPLYLGWLARASTDDLGEDDIEPPVPAGLARLTPAQQALADFLEMDPDWLSAAAVASPVQGQTAEPDYDLWLSQQPESSLRDVVRLLLDGRGREAERGVRQAFLDWQRASTSNEASAPRRRVSEIAVGVDDARQRRLELERQALAAAEAERQSRRASHLANLAAAPEQTWQQIDALLARGTGSAYDHALKLTTELAEALRNDERAFRSGLSRILSGHGKRPAWLNRLEKAGLMEQPQRAHAQSFPNQV